jgi:hypothetical protein
MLNFTGDRALHVSSCLHMRLCNQLDLALELAYGQPITIVGVSELLSRAKATLDPKQHRAQYPMQTYLGWRDYGAGVGKFTHTLLRLAYLRTKLQDL